jgi:hypothetical protein
MSFVQDAHKRRCPWMDSQKLCSLQFLSAYIPVGDVARGHDCMDAGGRATHGAVAEEVRSDRAGVAMSMDVLMLNGV